MGVAYNMYKTIMWKNCVLRKRHWFMTILEAVLPCVVFFFFFYARKSYAREPIETGNTTVYNPYSFDGCFQHLHKNYIVGFTPNTTFTNNIVTKLQKRIWGDNSARTDQHENQYFRLKDVKAFDTELELESYFDIVNNNSGMYIARPDAFYGIVFQEEQPNFKYKLRIGNEGSFRTNELFPELLSLDSGSAEQYQGSCFLTLQKEIDSIYIESVTGEPVQKEVLMNKFPFPAYSIRPNKFIQIMNLVLPYCVLFSYCIIIPNLVKRVVEEKETGVKELMKMMGLKNAMVWIGWLLHANFVNIFVTTAVTVLLTCPLSSESPPVILDTNPIYIWILLFLFMNAMTVYIFVVCAAIHRPLIASSVAVLVYFVPWFAVNILVDKFPSKLVTLLSCLLPTCAMTEAFKITTAYNSRETGISLENLFKTPIYGGQNLTFGVVYLMLLIDIFLYAIITWYIDQVRPGPFGRAKPWNFVFKKLFCKDDIKTRLTEDESDPMYFEKAPDNMTVGLSIRNLKKVFPPSVAAVNGVNIDIYKGQITALLGHNGAGKTTTMSILTGLFSPTSGSVYQHVSDTEYIDIFENMEGFRQDLGLCPQHNMLFSYFTVIQHLIFFGMLKGMTYKKAEKEGRHLLQLLNMKEKAKVGADKLSGGMKRKLSLAISLMSSPKVLMLDEPTSGMDPESRREMWDLLLSLREGRTIVITTHFMEEADVLGDRIAIMDHGKVRCYGTSMFLKKIYGAGYNLTFLTHQDADSRKITDIITNIIPGSTLKSVHKGQLVYNLPSEQSSKFAELFADIEKNKRTLNITSIGVSCTTMEDVFLKVGEISDKEKNLDIDKNSTNSSQETYKASSTEHLSPKRISGMNLLFIQFWLLLLKKIKFTYRKKWSFIFYIVLSMIMVLVAVYEPSPSFGDGLFPNLPLEVDVYENTNVYVAYRDEPKIDSYVNIYKNLISKPEVHLLPNKNITAELLEIGEKDLTSYKLKSLLGVNFDTTVTAFHSSVAIHAPPIALNLVMNTLLKSAKNSSSISVSNHPLSQMSRCSQQNLLAQQYFTAMKWVVTIPMGLLFVVANFIAFPLRERICSAKHLQLMAGVSPIMYWIVSFIWDYLVFLVSAVMLIIPVKIFDDMKMVSESYEMMVFLLIICLFGLGAIPFSYFFSFLKSTAAGATSSFVFYNFLFGAMGTMCILIMALIHLVPLWAINLMGYVLILNPFYCVCIALYKFSLIAFDTAMCIQCPNLPCPVDKYFVLKDKEGGDAVGFYLLILVLDFFLYFAIIFLLEFGIVAQIYNRIKSYYVKEPKNNDVDSDVKDEFDRVDAARINKGDSLLMSPVMVVDGLKKVYGLNFPAVKGVSFAVNSGECFGLLGVNGAGKTTTFKMLTGEEIPTMGDATITQFGLRHHHSQFLNQIGYCPQFDAINEVMTGREMIYLFAQLRGISSQDAERVTDYWIKFLGLEEYSDRLCGTYSGGNKRKLSTAMALVGDPVIVFLDEPTSGVDPVARRKLWSVLARSQKAGQSIVLTSHSMDECEALCQRLTIMVRGQMVCIGNIQYLKQRFGQGFTLMVNIHNADKASPVIRNLKTDIEASFAPNCLLKDEHVGLLHYHVTDTTKTWSMLFHSMNEIRKRNAVVQDYTVSETTLEQVFISFAKQDRLEN